MKTGLAHSRWAWPKRVLGALLIIVLLVASTAGSAYAGVERPTGGASDHENYAARTGKWIDIDLSQQMLRAYVGNKVVYSTKVSTGISRYPTVTGTFRIYIKNRSQRMSGGTGKDYYNLPNVPHVMFFYKDYAIHGAYWHNNFGRPMSHGCVNLPLRAASWMYSWAPMGTTVVVHK